MAGIEYIKKSVSELLGKDSSVHGDKHVFCVYHTAMDFCSEIPEANRDLVAAAALLHSCDDYKLFGEENARLLTNTRRILADSGFDNAFADKCIEIIETIGYSKRLNRIMPGCIEGKIVSDADMTLTEPGHKCLSKRDETLVDFLRTYFNEVDAPQIWKDLLTQYK